MTIARTLAQAAMHADAFRDATRIGNPRVLASLLGPAMRGFVQRAARDASSTTRAAQGTTRFDWTYQRDQHEFAKLYRLAKSSQWDADVALDWTTPVDPLSDERPLLPEEWVPVAELRPYKQLDRRRQKEQQRAYIAWVLSQFLHGEQGALFAAAQVTEAVQFFDGKLYGSTQVMDEGRHVEVFHRYLDTKMERLYQINDNLFVIIDALMQDGRWDMKFLGMQIMVEGVALGAFGTLYRETKEPLLKELLRNVIQDESRHVHYGVLALREHVLAELTERERREREDWAFEVALLMRNRFLAYEVYEEHFEGLITRKDWRDAVYASPGMDRFRHVMFSRMVPNLREIGLLSDRIRPHYARVGLDKYFGGLSADRLSGDAMIAELDAAA